MSQLEMIRIAFPDYRGRAISGENPENTLLTHPWALGSGTPDRFIPEKYGFLDSPPK
jgi:hypothetical protein